MQDQPGTGTPYVSTALRYGSAALRTERKQCQYRKLKQFQYRASVASIRGVRRGGCYPAFDSAELDSDWRALFDAIHVIEAYRGRQLHVSDQSSRLLVLRHRTMSVPDMPLWAWQYRTWHSGPGSKSSVPSWEEEAEEAQEENEEERE
eukprot:1749930-Rhodomonas_salina.1